MVWHFRYKMLSTDNSSVGTINLLMPRQYAIYGPRDSWLKVGDKVAAWASGRGDLTCQTANRVASILYEEIRCSEPPPTTVPATPRRARRNISNRRDRSTSATSSSARSTAHPTQPPMLADDYQFRVLPNGQLDSIPRHHQQPPPPMQFLHADIAQLFPNRVPTATAMPMQMPPPMQFLQADGRQPCLNQVPMTTAIPMQMPFCQGNSTTMGYPAMNPIPVVPQPQVRPLMELDRRRSFAPMQHQQQQLLAPQSTAMLLNNDDPLLVAQPPPPSPPPGFPPLEFGGYTAMPPPPGFPPLEFGGYAAMLPPRPPGFGRCTAMPAQARATNWRR